MWNQRSRGVPDWTVWDARPLGLQVKHVVPGLHVLGAAMTRAEIVRTALSHFNRSSKTHHLER